jgi:hypothetical protein
LCLSNQTKNADRKTFDFPERHYSKNVVHSTSEN